MPRTRDVTEVVAFLESFFQRYVEYDFTAGLEEQLDRVSNSEVDWKQVLRDFWGEFSAAIDATKDLRTTQVLDALNDLLGPHIFPARADGGEPRAAAEKDEDIVELAVRHLTELRRLLDQFADPGTPYLSRPMPKFASRFADYDHLARVKEWSKAGGAGEPPAGEAG